MNRVYLPADLSRRSAEICQQGDIIRELAVIASRSTAETSGADLVHLLELLAGNTPDRINAEMDAVAKGLDLGIAHVRLINFFDEVIRLSNHSASACSSVAVIANGKMLIGRSLDYGEMAPELRTRLCRYEFEADSEHHGFKSWGWPGCVGVQTGINDAGLWVATHTVPHGEFNAEKGTPNSMLYRLLLEKSSSIAEVEEMFEHSRPTCPSNLMVADFKTNQAAVFEIEYSSVSRRDPMEFNPRNNSLRRYIACTNQFHGRDWLGTENSNSRYLMLENDARQLDLMFAASQIKRLMTTWGIYRRDTVYTMLAHKDEITGLIGTGQPNHDPYYEPF